MDSSKPSNEADVLIVGLGPVGASFAAFCGLLGLRVIAVERDTEIYKNPRAVQIDHEILRQVEMIDVADQVLAASRPSKGYEFVSKDRDILVSRSRTDLAPTQYPYNNMFHQPTFEKALRERLATMPEVSTHLGCELVALEQSSDHVTASIKTAGGQEQTIVSRFVVGCDGGRSFVRKSLGVEMHDLGFDEPWLVVDVKLADGVEALTNKGTQLCDPQRPTTSTPSGPGRHRWEFMLNPDDNPDEVTQPVSIMKRIAEWVDPDSVTLERNAVYRFHGLVAQQWRKDRVMIIGDAAHQMPPFMGQGLCSGVRDATNLAWKLAAVIEDQASPALLDSVITERSPHVTSITESAIELGRLVCIRDPQQAEARDKQIKADQLAGKAPPFPLMPNIINGVLSDDAAGQIMPEPLINDAKRLDAETGYVPIMIVRDSSNLDQNDMEGVTAFLHSSPNARLCCLNGSQASFIQVLDSDGHLSTMMEGADALIAKPDRIVFGKGQISDLAQQWHAYLQGEQFIQASQTN
ncbi:MAG: bifunctional 3-(3-hydroxy-phenyl)propionate/3-hydroxycinnamic acid hydroxylase [Pseudomonadota bacterium]